jgi:hypothetical protein
VAVPTLVYRAEVWVIVSQQGRRTVGAEIKLLRDEYTYDEEVR